MPLENAQRPYKESDLRSLNTKNLRKLVEKQLDKWPNGLRWNTKVTKTVLRDVLLNAENGFTTDQPLDDAAEAVEADPFPPATNIEEPVDGTNTQLFTFPPFPLPWAPPTAVSAAMSSNALTVFPVNAPVNAVASSSGQPLAVTSGDLPPRVLRLYIVDNRQDRVPAVKTTTTIEVKVADYTDCPPGAWRVETTEILKKLQASVEAIHGMDTVMVGTPDDVQPEHTCHFVKAAVPELTSALTNPAHLVIPASNRPSVNLRIDNVIHETPQEVARAFEDHNDAGQLPPDFMPLEEARRRGRKKKRRHPIPPTSVVHYLETVICDRPGYNQYFNARRAILQNPEILSIWRFAVDFKNDYCDRYSSTITHQQFTERRIHKWCIEAALGVGETWLKDAEDGDHLVRLYGHGGSCAAGAVMEEIDRVREVPLGRGALLSFLRNWDAAQQQA